ncbi:hypothetical protein [Mycoplasmopsis synoviae]|uniref:hypothetical protein n=1 Tax=Mycoplasmopsis synoviae TaxID=2109 RepID=UPI003564476A
MHKYRKDGLSQSKAFFYCLGLGLIGGEYFYLKLKKLALIKLALAFVGATIIFVTLVVLANTQSPVLSDETKKAIDLKTANVFNQFTDKHQNTQALLPAYVVGGLLIASNVVWTIYNAVLIHNGEFKDNKKQKISQWTETQESYLEHLLTKGENWRH